ncbi:MAG TPA: hypothetical protein DEB31_11765 [Clostridiales bacterium]|nr:hypothetical protein [Clostridiales bacterium]
MAIAKQGGREDMCAVNNRIWSELMIVGAEYYQIVEKLGENSCALCREMDGRVFRMSEYQPGVTAPPFHPNCGGSIRYADEGLWRRMNAGYNGIKKEDSRDHNNPWASPRGGIFGELGIGALAGMKYDPLRNMIYASKWANWQKGFGYLDWYDWLSAYLLHFDLEAPKTEVTIPVKLPNGKTIYVRLTHRVWVGDYPGIPVQFREWIEDTFEEKYGYALPTYRGGESSLLINDQYYGVAALPASLFSDVEARDLFEQQIRIYDQNNQQMLYFDSAEMYHDKTSDWAYVVTPDGTIREPARIEGTIKNPSEALIRALAESAGSDIIYGKPRRTSDGQWAVDWVYHVRG